MPDALTIERWVVERNELRNHRTTLRSAAREAVRESCWDESVSPEVRLARIREICRGALDATEAPS